MESWSQIARIDTELLSVMIEDVCISSKELLPLSPAYERKVLS